MVEPDPLVNLNETIATVMKQVDFLPSKSQVVDKLNSITFVMKTTNIIMYVLIFHNGTVKV